MESESKLESEIGERGDRDVAGEGVLVALGELPRKEASKFNLCDSAHAWIRSASGNGIGIDIVIHIPKSDTECDESTASSSSSSWTICVPVLACAYQIQI